MMRVLCCLDGTNLDQVRAATSMLAANQSVRLALLYVTDMGPQMELGRTRERFFRGPRAPAPYEQQIRNTEAVAAEEIVAEALRHFPDAECLKRQGRPEREIVNVAAEWRADFVIVSARAEHGAKAAIGPKSVGRVARFVLDHAPCPVLLIRPLHREDFPIQR